MSALRAEDGATLPEVLVVVSDEREQADLHKFLSGLRMRPVVLGDSAKAIERAEQQVFSLALVDADTPGPGGGVEVLRALHGLRPGMPVVVLSAARSFDLVLHALRAGAADVVVKAQDQIAYLRQRVLALSKSSEAQAREERERLLLESAALNEEFLRRLTDLGRRVGDLRDQLSGTGSPPLAEDEPCMLLVVEEDGWLTQALSQHLPKGFVLRSVVSGGSALDKASGQKFHIALVKEGLPDLPGRMVVRTLAAQSPETITILFTPPGDKPGHVQVAEGSHMIPLLPTFTEPEQLAARLGELRHAQRTRGRERRYLTVFREEHYDLLRRYADLKQKLAGRG